MDYTSLEENLKLKIKHSTVSIIGSSVLGRPIYAINFDFGSDKTVIIQGAIHAREHITASLIYKQILYTSKYFDKLKSKGTPNIIFVPISNPDGVELAVNGITTVKSQRQRKFLIEINGGRDFSLFKANANGVDLNCNFDAKWGSGESNLFSPASHGYVGKAPMSEPCTRALAFLAISSKAFFTISYHSKGEEVYFDFYNKREYTLRDKKIAKKLARALHYKIKSTEKFSSGGYKDWCIHHLGIPAVTIEVGSDNLSHPITDEHLDDIYKRNRKVIPLLASIKREYENAERRLHESGIRPCKKGSK